MIGDKIKVKILETNGEYVEIGIDAPEDMIILRTELYEKFKATMDETV